ncbi:MAG: ParB family chromosome partitioning protein [Candidatus Krumholzibacteriia bacterium]|jgi:ParB family chromosome partitioning protein
MKKNSVLGKGLSALLDAADVKGVPIPIAVAQGTEAPTTAPLESIGFNVDQPRKIFDEKKLQELADSIKQVGVLQPVLVRKLKTGEKAKQHPESVAPASDLRYCVVAGERRVRASRLAGRQVVPVLVCTYEETEALKIALLENIQREDLGPVEEGLAYRNLMDAYGATQEELSEMLGKSRSGVANSLRILNLEDELLDLLSRGGLTKGHAKVLLGMPPGTARLNLGKLCERKGLSVKECEQRAQNHGAKPARRTRAARAATAVDPTVRALMDRAEQVYGAPVAIDRNKKTTKGTIQLKFYSDDDLIRLLKIMGVDTEL